MSEPEPTDAPDTKDPDPAVSARIGETVETMQLSWDPAAVRVLLDGELVEGASCTAPADADLAFEARSTEPQTRCIVEVSRDRMEATLRFELEPGCARELLEPIPRPDRHLHLRTKATAIAPRPPDMAAATVGLQLAGVVHGIDEAAVHAAIAAPSVEKRVVARGTEPVEGRNGYLEHLVDFEALQRIGVVADTPLLRRVRMRQGAPGRDVTGRELSTIPVREARLRPGAGVELDELGILAIATADGTPRVDSDGNVTVFHELVLDVVDTSTGDIDFTGSVHVRGDVGEGRRVTARDEILVEGNVDRATLDSGGSMRISGSIMSSVLRVGGIHAVAVTIADRVLALPRRLALVAGHARQLLDAATAAGSELSFSLAIQVVFERRERSVLPALQSIIKDLGDAGPEHADTKARAVRWHRILSTASHHQLSAEQYQAIFIEISALADDVQRALEEPANLTLSYMQASEAEATGTVTLQGKGIFNSRIVAGGGLVSAHDEAVLRGGSIVSHGSVHVREVGSPAGATTTVQLGASASLEAALAYAGTLVHGSGYTHRFVGDRAHVKVGFMSTGEMNVESLAA